MHHRAKLEKLLEHYYRRAWTFEEFLRELRAANLAADTEVKP